MLLTMLARRPPDLTSKPSTMHRRHHLATRSRQPTNRNLSHRHHQLGLVAGARQFSRRHRPTIAGACSRAKMVGGNTSRSVSHSQGAAPRALADTLARIPQPSEGCGRRCKDQTTHSERSFVLCAPCLTDAAKFVFSGEAPPLSSIRSSQIRRPQGSSAAEAWSDRRRCVTSFFA